MTNTLEEQQLFLLAKVRNSAGIPAKTSALILAKTSVTSPKKICVFIMKINIHRIRVPINSSCNVDNNITGRDSTVSGVLKPFVSLKVCYIEELRYIDVWYSKFICNESDSIWRCYMAPKVWMAFKCQQDKLVVLELAITISLPLISLFFVILYIWYKHPIKASNTNGNLNERKPDY